MTDHLSTVTLAPGDPILDMTEAFNADPDPRKVNLGVGVYQDAAGRTLVPPYIRDAARQVVESEATKSYLPMDGLRPFLAEARRLLLGPDRASEDGYCGGRAASVQTIGGTGALKIGADFLKNFFPSSTVWVSSPTWENHRAIFERSGFHVCEYPYFDAATGGVAFGELAESLSRLVAGSVVVLHACCHNPTGADLTEGQWREILEVCRTGRLIPFLDCAYQGFGRGEDEDASGVRALFDSGMFGLVAQSFSKTMSLYRERLGVLTVFTGCEGESARVASQLKRSVRAIYSSPPSHGAQVGLVLLTDPALRLRWREDVTAMRERIAGMRGLFTRLLSNKGLDFGFVKAQHGMFSFTGLSAAAVDELRERYSVYLLKSGRMCVAALNESNAGYVCDAVADVAGKG